MVDFDNVERWAKGNNLTLSRAKCARWLYTTAGESARWWCRTYCPLSLEFSRWRRLVSQLTAIYPFSTTSTISPDYSRPVDPPSAWHGRLITPRGVPSSRHSQVDVRCKCLVGPCLLCWPSTHRSCPSTWLVFWRCSDHNRISRPCWWRTVWESTVQPTAHSVQLSAEWNSLVLWTRHRPHNRELINKTSRLAEASFIVRMLYKDIY